MIQLDHISKRYVGRGGAVVALKNVSIHVEKGDIYGIIGFSGAGKSTLIRMVNRLETPDSGTVTVDGRSLEGLSKAELRQVRRKIGMVFQQFNLLESKTVFQNVAIPLILEGASKERIAARVEEVLRFVELEDKQDTYVSQLSGGQKQRVGTIGSTAALVPLIVYIRPYLARLIENSLLEISPGILEAAQAMEATNLQIIRYFLIPETLGSIVLGLTTGTVGLLGASAMAGYVGGGVGDLALTYG